MSELSTSFPKAILKKHVKAVDGISRWVDIDTLELAEDRKIVVFGLPGAFTPTCSAKHMPGFVEYESDIKARGIDEIICVSVNDAFVMQAWEKDQNSKGKVTLFADGNGDFTSALGLELDGTGYGLGKRSQRFAMIVQDGVIEHLKVEEGPGIDVSSAESILALL